MRFVLLILATLGWLTMSGCPKVSRLKPTSAPSTQAMQLPTLLQNIRAHRAKIKSLEGRAKLRVYHRNGRRSTYRLFFQLQRPNRLHFSITVASQPVVVATSDGKNCALYQVSAGQFWFGPSSKLPRVLGSFLPEQLPLTQLVSILFGEIPVLPAKKLKQTTASSELVTYELSSKSHKQTLWIHPTRQQFIKTLLEVKKKPALTLQYGTFRGNPPLPKRVIFKNKKDKQRFVWIFYSYTVNPKIPLNNFQQPRPKGKIKVHSL